MSMITARSTEALDQRIARALRGDADADEVAALIPETEAAASAMRETALRARERAAAAREEQDNAANLWDQLTTAVARLRERPDELSTNITN